MSGATGASNVEATAGPAAGESAAPGSARARLMERLDQVSENAGERFNPILVKETRQALKSRQFVVTFFVLLIAALGWTIIGSLSMMPSIYTSPSAPRMLIGYYVVLAIPMLLIVPLAAHRSLEAENDDGTLELLSISALSPWQIALGKLASAMLQMLLYFVVLFPCVAYAYTLRGVDLPTTLLITGILAGAGVLMTIFALFFAALSRGRTGRIVNLLVVIFVLLIVEYAVGALVIAMIQFGNPLPRQWTVYLAVVAFLYAVTGGHLLLTATAAQLTPESENRSTGIRVSLLTLTAVSIALVAYAIMAFRRDADAVFLSSLVFLGALWTVAGSTIVAESNAITPRIRRELPSSFLARATLTFLTPGPATGLVFVSVCVIGVAVAGCGGALALQEMGTRAGISAQFADALSSMIVAYACYLVGFLTGVRWLVALVRRHNNVRVEVGLAALITIAGTFALVPYAIELHLNDYNSFAYSRWQATNWAWTLERAASNDLSRLQLVSMVAVAAVLLLANVALLGKHVLPRRLATPARVRQELGR